MKALFNGILTSTPPPPPLYKILIVCLLAVLFAACDDDKDDNKPFTYTVNFDAVGGVPTPPVQRIEKGKTATEPENEPAKSDSVFNVWVNTATNQPYNFADPVTGDLDLRATYAAPPGITFNTDYLYNSEVERYHVVITKKGSGGAPDEVLENTVLSEGFYGTKSLLSQVADDDSVNLNVKAYKKPTQNTATPTAVPYPGEKGTDSDGNKYDFPPAAVDADGRILAATIDENFKGSDLDKPIELYFGGSSKASRGKARGSLLMVLDFEPFYTFLQNQNPSENMQNNIRISRQFPNSSSWTTMTILPADKKHKVLPLPDLIEIHQPLDIAAGDYMVELTLSTADIAEAYRFEAFDATSNHTATIIIPQPMYAGEKIDRTKAPLVFRNGTQELTGWPEPEGE